MCYVDKDCGCIGHVTDGTIDEIVVYCDTHKDDLLETREDGRIQLDIIEFLRQHPESKLQNVALSSLLELGEHLVIKKNWQKNNTVCMCKKTTGHPITTVHICYCDLCGKPLKPLEDK